MKLTIGRTLAVLALGALIAIPLADNGWPTEGIAAHHVSISANPEYTGGAVQPMGNPEYDGG